MSVRRYIDTTPLELFLGPDKPVFVNRISESFRLAEHNHEFAEINYVSEGSGYQYIDGKAYPVAKGDLFYIPIGVSHVFRPASAQPGKQKLIVYNCLYGSEFVRRASHYFDRDPDMLRFLEAQHPAQTWLHCKDRSGKFQRIFDNLYEEFSRKGPHFFPMMETEVIRLLVYIRRYHNGSKEAEGMSGNDDVLDGVIDAIREKLPEPVHIGPFASMAGLSERQFRRNFLKRTGMSFTDFVQKERIDLICALLVSTDQHVSEAAQKAGYQDLKFFNRLFKAKTGMTPTEYRNRFGRTGMKL